jgi:hypothetical protein
MMAKENKMLLLTTWWQYRYLVACVIPIDQYGVPLLVSPSLCVPLTRDSLHLFYYKERVKLPTWVRVHLDHLVSEMTKEDILYYTNFQAGARKPQRVETKMKRQKKVKEAFTDLISCATS